jgi:hypothetical protein
MKQAERTQRAKPADLIRGSLPTALIFLSLTIEDVDGRDIWHEDALRAFARP